MSRFEAVCEQHENGKYYNVYRDKKTNRYYRINDDTVEECFDLSIIASYEFVKKYRVKKAVKASTILLTSALVLGVSGYKIVDSVKTGISNYQNREYNELNELGTKAYLLNAIEENKSINNDMLNKYIDVISECDLSQEYIIKLSNLLKTYQFKENSIRVRDLELLLSLDDHGFVANQLYNYVNKIASTNLNLKIANLFVDDEDIVNKLFNGESLDELLSEKIDKDIDYKKLEKDPSILDEELNKNEEKYNEYAGVLNHNIFAPWIRKIVITENALSFDIYLKNNGNNIKDISSYVYNYSYYETFYSHDTYDYNTLENRVRLYYLVNAELNTIMDYDDQDEMIINEITNPHSKYLNKIDYQSYLSHGTLDFSKLSMLSDLAYYGNIDAAFDLLIELDKCLKIEVKENNMLESDYLIFQKNVLNTLQLIDYSKYETYWKKTNEENNSLEEIRSLKKSCNL